MALRGAAEHCELIRARDAFAEAFNLFGLGRPADLPAALALATRAVVSLRDVPCGTSSPGQTFVASRLEDTASLLTALSQTRSPLRRDVGTGLLAVDFLVQAVALQHRCDDTPEHCPSCHSPHLWRRDDGPAPTYECAACGFAGAAPSR